MHYKRYSAQGDDGANVNIIVKCNQDGTINDRVDRLERLQFAGLNSLGPYIKSKSDRDHSRNNC